MRRLTLLILAMVVAIGVTVACRPRPAAPAPVPGISLALAEERAARVVDLRYHVNLSVPAGREEPIAGSLRATFELRDATAPLQLDFAQPGERLLAVRANEHVVPARVESGHVVLPVEALVQGANVVEIEFVAGDAPLHRQDEFLYALFVPARASQAMPVFDQPDLKARWQLVLSVPPGWEAVSNGREVRRSAAPTHVEITFEETAPIPTYLFTLAAGRFTIETDTRDGRTLRMLHRETDAAKLARNRQAIFELHARALAWMESYTGIPYPFGKLDFVLIPSFPFRGMEHPGSIFYGANHLLLDESATQAQQLTRAGLIAHETAHMWFGDLVTMRWFDDVWLKEVFANFLAAKIVNPSFPDVDHELRFLLRHHPAAYEVDRTPGANPIRQELANLDDAGSLYGAIIYEKAPIVMRQLELLLGADDLRDGLRAYLRAFAYGNATWADLIALLDPRTEADLVGWSRAWVEARGRPRITIARTPSGWRLTQDDPLGRGLVWPQRLRLLEAWPDRVVDTEVELGPEVVLDRPGDVPIAWALPVGGGLGYGDFVLDEANLAAIAAALPDLPDALTRGAALVLLWESMLEGRLSPARMREVLLSALPRERDELLTAHLLDDLQIAFWRFTSPDERAVIAPAIDALLRDGLLRAPTITLRSAWFGTLKRVATTPGAVAFLEDLWRGEVRIPDLPLSESDAVDLARELALRDVSTAAAILDEQLARITDPDRRARLAFVRPALSGDAQVRERFFESLRDPANRHREAWVLEAVGYLHHPLRAGTSAHLVVPALGLVREIHQTGDIFFPKRWADATLGGHQSPEVAARVQEFIDALPPDYPPRLRWVLQASADPLLRAARIVQP